MGNSKNAQKRAPASIRNTGKRKSKKDDENIAPDTSLSPPAKPRPKARPLRKPALDLGPHTIPNSEDKSDGDEAAAAASLLNLKRVRHFELPAEHVFQQVVKIPGENLGMYDDEINGGDEQEDEPEDVGSDEIDVDSEECGIDSDDADSPTMKERLSVPVGTPSRKVPVFEIPFEVPFKNATRDLTGIKSTTP
ncbi:hypothetical protein BV22DRAFT_1052871, partial [Leucogyrophana mollusca]